MQIINFVFIQGHHSMISLFYNFARCLYITAETLKKGPDQIHQGTVFSQIQLMLQTISFII